MPRCFDRFVTASTNDPSYLPYWPIIAEAWRELFHVTPTLAFVAEPQDDYLLPGLQNHGEVVLFRAVPGIPKGNQAKVARLFLACNFNSEIVSINDVDLLPLQHKYLADALAQRKPQQLLCIGADVYKGTPEEGKCPMAYVSGESSLFKEIINPGNFSFEGFIKHLVGVKVFDHKEDVSSRVPVGNPDCFSDESVLRMFISLWNGNGERVTKDSRICHVDRGFSPYTARAIDRAAGCRYDSEKLKQDGYVEFHLPHPYEPQMIIPILEYVKSKY